MTTTYTLKAGHRVYRAYLVEAPYSTPTDAALIAGEYLHTKMIANASLIAEANHMADVFAVAYRDYPRLTKFTVMCDGKFWSRAKVVKHGVRTY